MFVPVASRRAVTVSILSVLALAALALTLADAHASNPAARTALRAGTSRHALEAPTFSGPFGSSAVEQLVRNVVTGTIAADGAPVTLTIGTAGDTGELTFSGTQNQRVFLKFTNNTFGSGCFQTVDVALLDQLGGTVASKSWLCTGSDYLETVTLPSTGPYRIVFTPVGNKTGSITTSLYDVPADPSPTLVPSQAGDSTTFTTSTPGQNAAPTFAATAGQRVFVHFTNNTISTDCLNTVDTWITGPNNFQTPRVDLCQMGSSDYIDTVSLGGGSYTLHIDPEAALTGSVTATIFDVPPDPTPTLVPSQAGDSTTFTTSTPGQNAAPTFAATAGQRVFVHFTNNTISTDCLNTVDTWITGPNNFQTPRVDLCQIWNSDYIDTRTLPTTGGYTLRLDPEGALTGSVTATIYDVPADVTGTLTVGGPSQTVTIPVRGQAAALTFVGSAGQPVKIAFTNNTIGSSCLSALRASIVTSGGTTIAGPSTMCLPGDSVTATLPSNGTYTVRINPDDANKGSVTVTATANAFEPPEQTFGTCGSSGAHGRSGGVCTADPVNSLTGAFTTSETDLTETATGVAFAFTRSYTSADSTSGREGPGWTDNYATALAIQPNGDVVLHGDEGQQLTYTKQPDGSFVGSAGAVSTLTSIAGGYKLLRRDQVAYVFDAAGVLQSERDRNAHGLTFAHDGAGRLSTITDSAGHAMTVAYDASNLISSVGTPDGRTVTYGYSAGRLASVTLPDPDGAGPLAAPVTRYTYDAAGRLASVVDPNNHTQVANVYDQTSGRVTQQTDANNKTTTFAWDAPTQTATITDANNHVWKDVYANNVLVKRIDATSKATVFAHDTGLEVTTVTSPDGTSTTSLTYDAAGNVLSATAPPSLGSVQKTFTYDAANNVKTVTDARNKQTVYSYDPAGNETSETLDGQPVASFTYDAQGRLATSSDASAKATAYGYGPNGNVTSVTAPDPDGAGPQAAPVTTYTYDAMGNVLTRVDPLGNCSGCVPADYRTTYTYDAVGHLLTETDPLGNTTTHTYDPAGNELTVKDANNHVTTSEYDNANNLVKTTGPDPDGAGALTAPVTTYTYDSVGNRLTKVDPRGNAPGGNPALYTTTYTYDANNRVASVTTPKGGKTTYTYEPNGSLATVVEPRGNVAGANPADYTTSYTYDAAGRMLTTTDALNDVTTNHYDAVGNVDWTKDANVHQTSYSYDAAGRILTVTAPDGGVTTYTYDANGNTKTRKDHNNHQTTFDYDGNGRLIQETGPDPDGAGAQTAPVTTYKYDLNGNRTSKVDPNGNATTTAGDGTTTYTYDRANRLKTIAYSGTATPGVSFTYDAVGNRTAMTDGSGSVSYVYDALDRVTSLTRGTNTFSYAYDAAGNVTSRTYPDATQVTYGYDEDNRLASVSSGGAATTYAYDPAGNLTQTTLPATNGYVETRAYDRAGRLVEVKSAKGATTLSDFVSTLDAAGNPTQVAQTGAVASTTTYAYDPSDRLTQVCFQTGTCPNATDPFVRWTYDKVGNRLTEARPAGTTTYTYNARDQLTQAGSTTHTYDQNGNEKAAGTRTFTYDLADRLATTTSGSTTTTYAYDGDGTRLQASTGTQATKKTNYLWDVNRELPQLALERDGNNALLRRYVYGSKRLAMRSGTADYYYHYDTLGSVRNVTSSTGVTQWTDTYEPFGPIRTETKNVTSAPDNPMKFVGEQLDATGLYHLRAREYDPAISRFLQVDPAAPNVKEPLVAPYVYAADRPTTMVDPSGRTLVQSDAYRDFVSMSTGRQRGLESTAARFAPCDETHKKSLHTTFNIRRRSGKNSGGKENGIPYFGYHLVWQPKLLWRLNVETALPPSRVLIWGYNPTTPRFHQIGNADNVNRVGKFSLHTNFKALPLSIVSWAGIMFFTPPIIEDKIYYAAETDGVCLAN